MTSVPPFFQHPGPPPTRPELPDGAPPPAPVTEAHPPAPDGLPPLRVPVWTPFATLLAVFVAVLVLSLVAGIFVGVGGGDLTADDTALSLVLNAAQFIVMAVFAFGAVQLLSGRRPGAASFGLRPTAPLRALGWTSLAYAGFWVVAVVVGLIAGEPEEQQFVREIRDEDSLALLVGFGVLSCLLAPVAEELFFRGFMFRAIAERVHWLWAAVVTGGVFGVVHAAGSPAISLVLLGAFGIALCLLFWFTRSVIPCMMLHAFNNAVSFGLTKGLPWWGILLLILGSVTATLAVALLVVRLWRPSPAPA